MTADFLDISLLEACGPIEVQLETGCDYEKYIIRMWWGLVSVIINQICFFFFLLSCLEVFVAASRTSVCDAENSQEWIHRSQEESDVLVWEWMCGTFN